MRTEALERARLVFGLFDADGNGFIEADDFALMGRRVAEAAPAADAGTKAAMDAAFERYWAALVGELDADGDNRIDFDEFTACVLAPERFDGAVHDFAAALSAMGDPDGDGYVERPLFVALMKAIGFAEPNIHATFEALGATADDRLAVSDWASGIREYYRPDAAGIAGDRLVDPSAA